VADPIRRPTALLASGAAIGFALLAVRYAGVSGPSTIDVWIDTRVQTDLAPIRSELRHFVHAAGPLTVIVTAIALAAACAARRRWRLALVALIGPLLTGAVTTVLQPAVGRTLEGGYALPSGHTAGVTAAATAGALVALGLVERRLRAVTLLGAVFVITVSFLMALALVANNLHYVTDTIAGFCVGIAVVLGTALIVDAVANRQQV
jgi:membrane-associated phospholipid phosphatase